MNEKKKMEEIGACWVKVGKATGKKYYTGKLTIEGKTIEFVMFPNSFKEAGDNKPDWKFYKSEPRVAGGQPAPAKAAAPAPRSAARPVGCRQATRPSPAAQAPAPVEAAPEATDDTL